MSASGETLRVGRDPAGRSRCRNPHLTAAGHGGCSKSPLLLLGEHVQHSVHPEWQALQTIHVV